MSSLGLDIGSGIPERPPSPSSSEASSHQSATWSESSQRRDSARKVRDEDLADGEEAPVTGSGSGPEVAEAAGSTTKDNLEGTEDSKKTDDSKAPKRPVKASYVNKDRVLTGGNKKVSHANHLLCYSSIKV